MIRRYALPAKPPRCAVCLAHCSVDLVTANDMEFHLCDDCILQCVEASIGVVGQVMATNDVVGLAEIAHRLHVPSNTVQAWSKRGRLPQAEFTVSGSPAWRWDSIARWATDHGYRVVLARPLVAFRLSDHEPELAKLQAGTELFGIRSEFGYPMGPGTGRRMFAALGERYICAGSDLVASLGDGARVAVAPPPAREGSKDSTSRADEAAQPSRKNTKAPA